MQIEGFVFPGAVAPSQSVDKAVQPVGLMGDDACVLAQILVTQFTVKQLGGPTDTPEGIFDLMSQCPGYLAERTLVLLQGGLPSHTGHLVNLAEFNDHAGAFRSIIYRRHSAVHGNGLGLQRTSKHFLTQRCRGAFLS